MCRNRNAVSDSPGSLVVVVALLPAELFQVVLSLSPLGVAAATASSCLVTHSLTDSPLMCDVERGSFVVPVVVIGALIGR